MELADRMKIYEEIGAGQRLIPNLPVCIRLDGKAFHQWTRGLRRPYDDRLHRLFDDTTKFLVEACDAMIGYTQSDEITLILYNGGQPDSQLTAEELEQLPPLHEARKHPDMMIRRQVIVPLELPPLLKLGNRTEVIFRGCAPEPIADPPQAT